MSLYIDIPAHSKGDICPACLIATLKIKHGKFGKFLGCSRYPDCKYTCNKIKKKTNDFFKNGHISKKNRKFLQEARKLENEHNKILIDKRIKGRI